MPTKNHDRGIDVIIAGASVRAAAASALRAGLRPWCVDLFADADLAAACPVRQIPSELYPKALRHILAAAPRAPWLYTGALENHSILVAEVPRPLWGNSRVVLSEIGPLNVMSVLREGGFDAPEMPPVVVDRKRRWLLKPSSGAAGVGIREWKPGARVDVFDHIQEYVEGESASAVYLGRADGSCELLGATFQLVGTSWLHTPRLFQYAGSIGPLPLSTRQRTTLEKIGQLLTARFGLRGLFGIDFITRDDRVWPVEVNPRYTASVELLERLTGRTVLWDHARCFEDLEDSPPGPAQVKSACHGKAILFAQSFGILPPNGPWQAAFDYPLDSLEVPFADIPHPGHAFRAGEPILTFFSPGETIAECEASLRKIAGDLDRALFAR